jgi:K+-transporting ATPase ATPase C chain
MKHIRPAIAFTLFFLIVTGLAFPAVVFGLSQALFPRQANGSLVKNASGQVVGSELIGQSFSDPKYFHPRPSAAGSGYDGANSSGTNLGPTSDKLINGIHDPKNPSGDFDGVKDLAKKYREENGLAPDTQLPADAVTRSASGLDPEISIANAELQVARVAKARRMNVETVRALIGPVTSGRFAGIYGDPAVNVLRLNLALDQVRS